MTLEERYKKAAAIIGRSVEYLKEIDADGPCCESSLPVCECILQDCDGLTHCHFKEKWWEKDKSKQLPGQLDLFDIIDNPTD